MAHTADTRRVFSEAGKRGAPIRKANHLRLIAIEREIDPDGVLGSDERRAAARLLMEIEDRERELQSLTAQFIERRKAEIAEKTEQLRQLTLQAA